MNLEVESPKKTIRFRYEFLKGKGKDLRMDEK